MAAFYSNDVQACTAAGTAVVAQSTSLPHDDIKVELLSFRLRTAPLNCTLVVCRCQISPYAGYVPCTGQNQRPLFPAPTRLVQTHKHSNFQQLTSHCKLPAHSSCLVTHQVKLSKLKLQAHNQPRQVLLSCPCQSSIKGQLQCRLTARQQQHTTLVHHMTATLTSACSHRHSCSISSSACPAYLKMWRQGCVSIYSSVTGNCLGSKKHC